MSALNAKLTLSMDRAVIESAKKDLQTKERSLSKIAEDYFKVLLATKEKRRVNTPIVSGLTGIAALREGKSDEEIPTEYLNEKYK